MSDPRIGAVIMAAGKGTRLKTELPKVLHEVCGRPMLAYVFDACRAAGVRECVGVVGYKQELVREAFANAADIAWIEQNPQQGTGHAVRVCRDHIANRFDHVLVLCGDGPLVRPETLKAQIEQHIAADAVITLATAIIDDPSGYGRIHRDADGKLLGIVEQSNCTADQLEIREINPSMYCFRAAELLTMLDALQPQPPKDEYYITDTLAMALERNWRVQAITAMPPEDIFSINTRRDLALVNGVMRDRVLGKLMDGGVTIVDPASTWIDDRATIGQDTIIYPFTAITGPAQIGVNCRIGPNITLGGDQRVDDNAVLVGGAA